MKTIRCLGVVAVVLALAGGAGGEEVNLVSLVKEGPKSPKIAEAVIGNPVAGPGEGEQQQGLKPLKAAGVDFLGMVVSKDGSPRRLSVTTGERRVSAEVGREAFDKLAAALTTELGAGKLVDNIPNHEDGSVYHRKEMLWFVGTEVIRLVSVEYPPTYLAVVRQEQQEWRRDMGPDEGVFWAKVMKW